MTPCRKRPCLEVTVVAQFNGDEILQALRADALARVLELLLAERDAVRTDAMFSCRPAHERAPAAADVEQAFASLQAQLAADVLQLVALSLVQRVIRRLEIAT